MKPRLAPLALATLAAALPGQCHPLAGLTAIAQDAMAQLHLTGLVLRVDQHGQGVYAQTFGSHTPGQVMALASATKTLTAAVLLSLCDQNLLHLDDPVGNYLPEYAVGPLAAITLRMCMVHTSGLPPLAAPLDDQNITLRQAAQQIAQLPLLYAPGTEFAYGEVSMQVAGAACEVAAGLPWSQLFLQRVADPLGMTATSYTAFGATLNPRVADAGVGNADDYARFLDMLRQGGTFQNQRVLSAASVEAMLTDQMSHLPVRGTPHPGGVPCGIGCWIERRDALGRTTLASMPGLYGFFGWLDRARDSTGVWLGTSFYVFTFPFVGRCWDVADLALSPLGCSCLGSGSPACAAAPQLNATTWARAGQTDFGFALAGAPLQAPGGLLVGLGPATPALPVLDLLGYVPGPSGFLPWPTDALGGGRLSVPLPAITGATVTLQGCWLDAGGCGSSGLRASHALQLDVLPP